VTWSTSSKSIAKVSPSGLVTGVAAGKATITATSEGVSGKTTVTVTTSSSGGGSVVLVGAGDIAGSGSGDEATAQLLDQVVAAGGSSVTVFTAGDNAYSSGSATEFSTYYDPTWGRHRSRTRPSPGNHDYSTSGASGYFGYFGSQAGPSGRGYYSYDAGNWHIVSLNSEVATSAGSAQEQWLRSDLAATSKPCVLAYWHKPRFSSGSKHGSDAGMGPLFKALYDYHAEVVVSGHDHEYERFAPQDPSGTADPGKGIRQFVAGTGGESLSGFGTPLPNSEVRYSGSFGVLKLTLGSSGYTWEFIPVSGSFRDSGNATCH
jgi:calcineurin-like phosphoesterase family protein/Big-like domain-containing protein